MALHSRGWVAAVEDPAPRPDAREERHRVFAEGLSAEERVLLLVRDELYGGSWEELEADLHARRERKPAIFKLNTRIDEDLGRIIRLRAFEREHGVDLRRLLDLVTGTSGELERTP